MGASRSEKGAHRKSKSFFARLRKGRMFQFSFCSKKSVVGRDDKLKTLNKFVFGNWIRMRRERGERGEDLKATRAERFTVRSDILRYKRRLKANPRRKYQFLSRDLLWTWYPSVGNSAANTSWHFQAQSNSSELPVVPLQFLICCVICQVMQKPIWERKLFD